MTMPYHGAFESHPAIFTSTEAWVLIRNAWRDINAAELMHGAAIMTKVKFKQAFGAVPPLPEHAFS